MTPYGSRYGGMGGGGYGSGMGMGGMGSMGGPPGKLLLLFIKHVHRWFNYCMCACMLVCVMLFLVLGFLNIYWRKIVGSSVKLPVVGHFAVLYDASFYMQLLCFSSAGNCMAYCM